MLDLSQADLAVRAHVSDGTVSQFEQNDHLPSHNNRKAIREVLEAAGVDFIVADPGGGPGVRLRTVPAEPSATPSPEQLRAGRMMVGLSQKQLADAAGLGRSTVADYERRARVPNAENLDMLGRTLEDAGIVFIAADGGGPGVRLKVG